MNFFNGLIINIIKRGEAELNKILLLFAGMVAVGSVVAQQDIAFGDIKEQQKPQQQEEQRKGKLERFYEGLKKERPKKPEYYDDYYYYRHRYD